MALLPQTISKPVYDIKKSTTMIYGKPKIGKSTFAAQFPGALFLDFEGGLNYLTCSKVPIANWEDAEKVKQELLTTKHNFQTIVIDTVDIAYKRVEEFCSKQLKVEHISEAGFGKGSARAAETFMKFVTELKVKGYGIVFTSHAQERELITKTSKTTYMSCSLPPASGKNIMAMCDFIFYCYTSSENKRCIRTKGDNKLEAGDRSGILPQIMDIDFKAIDEILTNKQQQITKEN